MAEVKPTEVSIESLSILDNSGEKNNNVPILRVVISGAPSLGGILEGMKRIRESIEQMPQEYVAITDISQLEISKFVRSVILFGMEASYKGLLAVKHQALLSLVIIDKRADGAQSMVDMLQRINAKQLDGKDNYAFRYEFVSNEEEAVAALTTFWNQRAKSR